jgi:hypothetical protein
MQSVGKVCSFAMLEQMAFTFTAALCCFKIVLSGLIQNVKIDILLCSDMTIVACYFMIYFRRRV